jgi:hypothetical protein
MKYGAEMSSGVVTYIPSFIKNGTRTPRFTGEGGGGGDT